MQDGCKLTRCIRCSLSTRIGMRTEFFENDRPMILGWIVTRVVRLRAVLVRVRFGSGTRLHFTSTTGETAELLHGSTCCARRNQARRLPTKE